MRLAFIAAGFALLHVLLVLQNFPPRSAAGGNPLSTIELSFHLAGAMEGRDIIAGQHHLWGYSPRYMAGYPFGGWNSLGTRGYEMSSALLPFLSFDWAYYTWVAGTAILPPLLIALAAWLMTRSAVVACVGLILAVVVWQFGNMLNYFWTTGMIAFPFVESVSVLYLALLYRAWTSPGWGWPLLAGLCLGAIFWLHTLVLLSAGLATAAMPLLGGPASGGYRAWLRLAAAGVIAALVSLPWLLVLLRFNSERGYMDLARIPGGWKAFVMDFFSDRRYRFPFDRRALLHLVLALGAVGAVCAKPRGHHGLAVAGATALGLLFCAYLFPLSKSLDQTEPYRYVGSAKLFAILPAALGLVRLGEWLRESNRSGRLAAAALAAMLLPAFTGYALDIPYRLERRAGGLDPARLSVAHWLREHAAGVEGRVLCEEAKLGNALPYFADVAVIGGTIGDESVLPHRWTGAGVGGAFGLEELRKDADGRALAERLRLYNVAFVVAQSAELCGKLDGLTGLCARAASLPPFTVFAVNTNGLGYIEGGTGASVRAGPNRIEIDGAPAGEFTLKFHYLPSLRASAGVELHPVKVAGDPVPFIGVRNASGSATIRITNAYELIKR